jgi:acetate---CoA ligase (ADP-forming)
MRSAAAPAALASIPCFAFPEPAAIAMARVAAYGEWRRTPPGTVPALDGIIPSLARAVIDSALQRGGGWLSAVEANALMAAVGVATPQSYVAGSIDEAGMLAQKIGLPVALKAIGRELLHKTEHDAIRLNLRTPGEVRDGAAELTTALGDKVEGLMVQRMVTGGAEMMIGAINDPAFGHVIVCGSGGVLIELLADSQCRLYPVTGHDAIDMVKGLRGVRLLRGFRGRAPADINAFREAILRISALIGLCPEIEELDVNPLMVLTEGASALDVRVRVSADVPGRDQAPATATSASGAMNSRSFA